MKQTPDSSICIAALIADHEAHDRAAAVLSDCDAVVGHVAAETYSVLTRLPPPHRLDPGGVASMIAARLPAKTIALAAGEYEASLQRFASAQIVGGAIYDGLIALAASEHGLELVSRDLRAARTYRALGVNFSLLR